MPELRIKGTLGEGGMGLVELAEQLSVGRDVAVKKVRQAARSERATLVLLREGWTTGLLEHPNIVPVYTLGRDDDGEPVIVMKKIAGTSWLEIIEEPQKAPDGFDADDPTELHVEVLIQVCNAVHYAHEQGIIHRDLKPENVMLGEFGEVYVLDWGIAVSLRDEEERLARASDVQRPAGTPAYMAPEMVDGDGKLLGVHTDVFLLGAMLYEALTGQTPYSGKSLFAIMMEAHVCKPPEFGEDVSPELAAICRRAMAREPEDRFGSARELRDALYDYRRHRQVRRLTDRGEARLAEVRQLLAREGDGEEVDERSLYRIFGECRFAYDQALEMRPGDVRAVAGLQAALEAMAERALERDAHKAAGLLIAELPQPNKALQARHDELAAHLATRREDFEELQQLRHDVDVNVGRRGRIYFVSIVGAIWVVLSFALAFALEKEIVALTYPRMFAHIVGLTVVMAGVGYLGRHYFFENELNRRMIYGVLAMFMGAACLRALNWIWVIDYRTSFTVETLFYAVGAATLGVALDRRLIVAGLPFLGTAFVGALWPGILFWAFASANAMAVAVMIWMWWPEDGELIEGECVIGNKS